MKWDKNSIQQKSYRVTLAKFFSQQQRSYLKDTTDFIDLIEKTKLPKELTLVSMDVTSLYTKERPNIHPHSKVLTRELI